MTPAGTLNCTTGSTSIKTGPKNEPQVNLHPGGNAANFSFLSSVCIKTSVSTPNKGPNSKTGPVDLCVLTATGVVAGFCGLLTGSGIATVVNLTSSKETVTVPFKFTGVGPMLYFSGGGKQTNMYAAALTILAPFPGTSSCNNTTAASFLVTGVANYKDCTAGTTAGICHP